MAAMADLVGVSCSREALHQRLTTKAAARFMTECVKLFLNQKLSFLQSLKLKLLRPFNRVRIVDSSGWDVNSALKRWFKGAGGIASKAGCKIQVSYELKKGELEFYDLTKGTYPDGKYSKKLPDFIEKGDLLIADLGYYCFETFRKILEKSAYFLSRFKTGTKVWDGKSNKLIDVEKLIKDKSKNLHDINVFIGQDDNNRVACRLVAFLLTQKMAKQRRKELKKKYKRKGLKPSKRQLNFCGWTIMLTNVPQKILPTEKIIDLYSARWQIELIFKQMKSVLQIHKSNTKNPKRLGV